MTRHTLRSLLLVLLLFCSPALYGQIVFSGKILDEKSGEPIPNATTYIHEIRQGCVADLQGHFSLRVPAGSYTVEFRSMGYETLRRTISINADTHTNIKLHENVLALKEVQVVGKKPKEDPAYRIMREVMRRVPYYEQIISGYEAELYTKNTAVFHSVPFFMKGIKVDNVKLKEYLGKYYVSEWHIKASYRHPDVHQQNILAYRTSMPKDLQEMSAEPDMNFRSNVYGKDVLMMTLPGESDNPLRSEGLEVYRYRLEKTVRDGNRLIYHISYQSKNPSLAKTLHGEICVVDGMWQVQSLHKNYGEPQAGMMLTEEIELMPIRDDFYMPVSEIFKIKIKALGFDMAAQYFSSVRYNELTQDARITRELGELASGKAPTRQIDLYRQTQAAQNRLLVGSSVIKDKYFVPEPARTKIKASTDSMALKRDTTYWDDIRTAPLDDDEQRSYDKRDSLMKAFDKIRSRKILPQEGNSLLGDILLETLVGKTHSWGQNKQHSFAHTGLLTTPRSYNYSDGLLLGQSVRLQLKHSSELQSRLSANVSYAWLSKKWQWDFGGDFFFAPRKRGHADVKVFNKTTGLDGELGGGENAINTLFTLLDGRGSSFLTYRNHISASMQYDIINGLAVDAGFALEDVEPCKPVRVWSLGTRLASFNKSNRKTFDPKLYPFFDAHRSLTWQAEVEINFTPYYRILANGRKVYHRPGARSPLITLLIRQAISRTNTNDSRYLFARTAIDFVQELGQYSQLRYRVEGGAFLDNSRIYPTDRIFLSQANSGLLPAGLGDIRFFSLPAYTTAANEYAIGKISYIAPALLFNRLPIRYLQSMREEITAQCYWDIFGKPYLEAGYILKNGIFDIGFYYGGYNGYQTPGFGINFIFNSSPIKFEHK